MLTVLMLLAELSALRAEPISTVSVFQAFSLCASFLHRIRSFYDISFVIVVSNVFLFRSGIIDTQSIQL